MSLDGHLSSHVSSINTARNCLVHRGGIVSERDLTTGTQMEVTWRRMYFFLQDDAGEKPVQIGDRIEKDSMLCVRVEDISKAFCLGQSVKFSVQEFSDVCWSLFAFGQDLVQKMNAFGVQNGFLKTDTGMEALLADPKTSL